MNHRCKSCGRPLPTAEFPVADAETASRPGGDEPTVCMACRESGVDPLGPTATFQAEASAIVSHFALIRVLGSGSFGEVWLAEDLRLGRSVALKLPSRQRPDAETLLHEAKTAASLRHPNIVTILEVDEDQGQIWIASELIEGITLSDFLTAGIPPIHRVIELLMPIAAALHYAHQRGVVHRDVKPSNILLNDAGEPFVTDFGIAKRLTEVETISSHGQIVGTVRYMSPEQASGKTGETDARSDIYAVGVMLFEMLTGEPPFRGNVQAVIQQKTSQDAASPRLLAPGIPKDLETICLKCLEREPSKRFATAEEFREELRRYAAGEPIRSRPISRLEQGWRWCKRRPAVSVLVLSLFLSLATGLAGVTHFWRQSAGNAVAAHRSLYRSWMNLAAIQLESGNPASVRELLTRIEKHPQLEKMRGFDWRFHANQVDRLRRIGNVGSSVSALAITHDGNLCAATAGGQQIRVWDTRTLELVQTLEAEQEGFRSLTFSSANGVLAAGALDGFVRFYEPLAGARLIRQVRHGPPVRYVCFSPDGRRLISAGAKGAVRLWSLDEGRMLAELPTGGKGETKAIRFSHDSARLFVARDDGRIRQWLLRDAIQAPPGTAPTPELEFDTHPALVAMAVSDDGERLVVGCYDGVLAVCSLAGEVFPPLQQTLNTHWGLLQAMEFVPDSDVLAVTSSNGSLYAFDLSQGREVDRIPTHSLSSGKLARSNDRQSLAVGSGDGAVLQLATRNLDRPSILWGGSPVRSVSFLPGVGKLLAAYEKGDLTVWDARTGEHSPVEAAEIAKTQTVAVDIDRGRVATGGIREGVEIRDAETFEIEARLPATAAGVSALRFSRSGELFGVATRGGPVRIYATEDWRRPQFEFVPATGQAASLAFSLDERLVAIARKGRIVDVLNSSDGDLGDSIEIENGEPSAVEFCQDGATLAIGVDSGEILFWDLASRRVRVIIHGHTGRINALAVLPASEMLISGGQDKRLKLWDVASGELVAPLVGHFRQIFSIDASADGSQIVSGGLEGDVRIWRDRAGS